MKAQHIAAVAEDHRLQDVGIELQLVLDVFRREQVPVGHLAHVLRAVDDPQVAGALLDEAGVAGRHPALGSLVEAVLSGFL
jgi:hypothetical protein